MTNAKARFNKIHIRKVYACLAVTCHLHFWQNDRDFLRATVVTRGWNGYRNKSQHRKSTLEKKFSRRSSRDSNPRPFNHESGALTTELSPPPSLEGSSHRALYQTFDRPKLVNGVLYRDTCVSDQKRKQLVLPVQMHP